MKIRQAILAAADSIEQNPDLFEFGSTDIPNPSCGSTGCAIGWIALHLGYPAGEYMSNEDASGKTVYQRLGIPLGEHGEKDVCFHHMSHFLGDGIEWKLSPIKCAQGLRLYADRYHPEISVIPKVVTDIFKVREAA